jgi:hypothetical protein
MTRHELDRAVDRLIRGRHLSDPVLRKIAQVALAGQPMKKSHRQVKPMAQEGSTSARRSA